MAAAPRKPYRRRNFLVKHGFQLRFALLPIGFLSFFLLIGGLYLRANVQETLEYYLYLPHSRLQNPWEVVGPAIVRVAAGGGAVFLAVLGAWAWRRFSGLHRDFERLAGWMGLLVQGREGEALPALGDPEVRSLAEDLRAAVHSHGEWDREVAVCRSSLQESLRALANASEGELAEALASARGRWRAFEETVSRIRVEEDLG